MKKCYFIVFSLISFIMKSQNILIDAKIIDRETQEALSFSTIKIKNTQFEFLSDIDGEFKYESTSKFIAIVSLKGYKSKEVFIEESNEDLFIELEDENESIEENDLKASYIIQKVLENKKQNDPYKYKSFEYNSYNKFTIDYRKPKKGDYIYDILDIENIKRDTTISDLKKETNILNSIHQFIAESTSKRRYNGNISEEIILANKVSGISNPSFALVGREFQIFSFYDKDYIHIEGNRYINPISQEGIYEHNFKLVDTIFYDSDTIFHIILKPKSEHIDGFRGSIFISKRKYAIYAIDLKSFEKEPVIHLKHKYSLINGKWFPKEMYYRYTKEGYSNVDIVTKNEILGKKEKAMSFIDIMRDLFSGRENVFRDYILEGRNYIKDVDIDIPIQNDFRLEEVVFKNMKEENDEYWDINRVKGLNLIEHNTYSWLDSCPEEKIYEKIMEEKTRKEGEIRVSNGYLNLNLYNAYSYNQYEKHRINLMYNTTEKVSKNFNIGAYLGYGSGDQKYKYGVSFKLNILDQDRLSIALRYKDDLYDAGNFEKEAYLFDHFGSEKYHSMQNININLSSRILRYLKINTSLSTRDINRLHDTSIVVSRKYKATDLNIGLRFAFDERFLDINEEITSIGTSYPILDINYTRGLGSFLQGNLKYNKILLNLEQKIENKLGVSKYILEVGYVDKILPYGEMFTGEGSNYIVIRDGKQESKNNIFFSGRSFETAFSYEFLSDRYINLYLSHNFVNIYNFSFLYQRVEVGLSVHHNMSHGNISDANNILIKDFDFKVKDKLFTESGAMLNIGMFSAGAFYRYGEYAINGGKFGDNIFYKIGIFIKL